MKGFSADRCPMAAAALAFFGSVSLAPVLIVALWVFDLLQPEMRQRVIQEIGTAVGGKAGEYIVSLAESVKAPATDSPAGWIAMAFIVIAAMAAFLQLEKAMNTVWKSPHVGGRHIWRLLRRRLLSLLMLVTLAALLGLAIALSASVMVTIHYFGLELAGWFLEALDFAVGVGLLTLAFMLVFKLLPEARVVWADAAWGGLLTAVLFNGGKILIGLYLARATTASRYGAAGSVVALLLWLYFEAMFVLFGAEWTRARAEVRQAGQAGAD